MLVAKELINRIKRNGANFEPCGTPIFMGIELVPSIDTLYDDKRKRITLFVYKLSVVLSTIFIKIPCFTESKAFLMS